ncbi:uncharacterized protein SPSK_01540 [Sporothrix schenckii 1099-18]|uniref:Uncharacterized protein n=1 Tax=Sporothrix schenckii 1099-18 TaxID=1397361 RepID=A0A0F2MBE9_SPOSC|nr:uncharacterized protein SPSK_01540 [Sporothrix schenckii 1099-18]KJR87018.1 hypothetical protein SPSK_01540 [Sporothrix schenckii 1099-18]
MLNDITDGAAMASISAPPVPPPLPPASTTTTVHFPRRQWVTFDAEWKLTLTATAELAWDTLGGIPGSYNPGVFRSKVVTAARVAELVRAGRLWIGSDGRSVDLTVRPMLEGKRMSNGGTQGDGEDDDNDCLCELFRETIMEWPVWKDRLGLRVRSRSAETGSREGPTLLYLTVTHPSSPGGLFAPSQAGSGIPLARLLRVTCQLGLRYSAEGFKLPRATVATKRATSKAQAARRSKPKPKSKRANRPFRSEEKPPPARKNPRPRPREAARRQRQQQVIDPRDVLVVGSAAWRQSVSLITTALHVLVGTAGKAPPVPGIRPVDAISAPHGAPSLLDVAPAVWSNHYFTAVSSRAVYVPLIHRCLASFTNAQSASLRRKAEALAESDDVDEFVQANTEEGPLMRKLEEILLKIVMQLRLRPKKSPNRRPDLHEQTNLSRHVSTTWASRALKRPGHPSYLPIAPGPSHLSPAKLQSSPTIERLDFEPDEDQVVDLSHDNLEAIFTQSSAADGSSQEQPLELEVYAEANDDDVEIEAQALDWQDIEAWSEPNMYQANEYMDDEDSLFDEISEGWSPDGQVYEENEVLDEDQEYEDGLNGTLSDEVESGHALWQDMQAWQLDRLGDFENESWPMHHDMGYMDDDEIEFMDIAEEDLDEGVGLWRDDSGVIKGCL